MAHHVPDRYIQIMSKTFTVVTTGLIVPGMPFRWTIATYKRESAAIACAARYRANHAPVPGTASKALCEAFRVTIEVS